jgi:putative membrane protein
MTKPRLNPILLLTAIALALASFAPTLLAHEIDIEQPAPTNAHDLLRTWAWEPGTLICLALSAWFYAAGLLKLWLASGIGHGIRRWQATCFAAGWLTLVIALVSPIHPLGQVLFSAHMTQHELLMLVAAPLLVLGQPMIAFLRALPPEFASALARASNTRTWRAIWGTISTPAIAWLIHALVLWLWHAPALFQATLHNDWVHAAQHTSFLLSALLFWWAMFHTRRNAESYGVAVLYLFTTAVHSGLLGALLTFARSIWYPAYAHTTQPWGLSPLEDQQIGGLIMWVPACLVYIVAGLVMFAGWLRQSENRVLKRELASAAAGFSNARAPRATPQ